jgi:hypothetical protein
VKIDPAAGAAVSVTAVPASKLAWQLSPQLIPAGLELTSPEPVPCFETLRSNLFRANVAVGPGPW